MNPIVTSGTGDAGAFVAEAAATLRDAVGFTPFHGTLNVRCSEPPVQLSGYVPWERGEHCDGIHYGRCRVSGVRGAVIRPVVPSYPDGKTELVAPVSLRQLFGLNDGDELPVEDDSGGTDSPMDADSDGTNRLRVNLDGLSAFGAVALDLDETLVALALDGEEGDAECRLAAHLGASSSTHSRQELLRLARERGVFDDVDCQVPWPATREADSGGMLLLSEAERLDCPVGLCTALDGTTADSLLRQLGRRDAFDRIVSWELREKRGAERLTDCLEALGCIPGDALLIADHPGRGRLAQQAETSFVLSEQVRTH